jgi:manganese transport protein
MRFPWSRALRAPEKIRAGTETERPSSRKSLLQFLSWVGPALMVSIAYMDPGNYGTDIQGAFYGYDLLWAVWLASGMAMLLQYLSGKLGIASGFDLAQMVRKSFGGKRKYVVPYWLAAEAAAAATDLAEYLGTVIALNWLFGVPLLYAAIFGALDVILLLTMMTRRFRLIEQYFALLISVLVGGIFYNLFVVHPSLGQIGFHSIFPMAPTSDALLIVVGMIGATVMPHALFVHSWLTKNKMDLLGQKLNGNSNAPSVKDLTGHTDANGNHSQYSSEKRKRTNKLHRNETIIALTIAGVVNAGILLVAIPVFQHHLATENSPLDRVFAAMGSIYGPAIGILIALTLLASGLSSSALGTIAGQAIMEGLIGKHWNMWARRIITRCVNVFPTTIAILLGLDPLRLLVYSQVILSLMIPLPMIPLVYYTSKTKFMGALVNKRITIVLALITVVLILFFNGFLLTASF